VLLQGITELVCIKLLNIIDCADLVSYVIIWQGEFLCSPHSTAMLKGLYFTAVVFFSFFRCLISEVTEWIPTKLGHIFTYDCYLKKKLVRAPQAFTPTGCGAKKTLFWDRL